MIDKYFNDIEEKSIPDQPNKKRQKGSRYRTKLFKSKSQQITITGFALHLGLAAARHLKTMRPKASLPIVLIVPDCV